MVRRRRNTLRLAAVCAFLSGAFHVALFFGLWRFVEFDPPPPPEPKISYIDLQPAPEPPPPPESLDEEELAQLDADVLDELDEVKPRKIEVQPPKLKPREKKKEKEKEKPEVELEELAAPEEKEEKPPEEEKKEEVQPPPDFELALKMVEQPDQLDEKESPEEFDYLSNINRDVQEQTRAEQTNLEKDALKPELHQTEKSDDKKPGTSNEEEIRQTEKIESQENRKAPPNKPQNKEQRPSTQQAEQEKKPLLAMRELEQRDHKLPNTSHEALAAEADDGTLQKSRKLQAGSEAQKSRAFVQGQDKAYMSRLNQSQLEALYGKDQVLAKRNESKKQSKTKGVWDDQRNHWQSPLENMVPEVQPGNQTALRSRKHPFARYIAQMHRKIHEGWAFGFLDQLDSRARNHPLNEYELWSRVEIVIAADGTIEKVQTIRHSGKTAFDAAAREIVWSAGPFPDPPPEIVSGNGKIYVHWAFHRDERACGTFGAQPFILDGSGQGDRPDADKVVRAGAGAREETRRLSRKPAPKVAEGPSAPAGAGSGSGEHAHDHEHGDHEHGKGEGGGSGSGESGTGSELTPEPEDLADDPKAKSLANEWLYYFSKGQIDKVVSRSSLPFYAGDSPIARTRPELKELLATMSEESKAAGKPKGAKVYTAAGLRKVFGSVPAGVQEGGRRVYGLTKVGSEYVVLMLEKKFGSWRVVGVAR